MKPRSGAGMSNFDDALSRELRVVPRQYARLSKLGWQPVIEKE